MKPVEIVSMELMEYTRAAKNSGPKDCRPERQMQQVLLREVRA